MVRRLMHRFDKSTETKTVLTNNFLKAKPPQVIKVVGHPKVFQSAGHQFMII